MKNSKNVLDDKAFVADAAKQNKKIEEMMAKSAEVIATNDLKAINQYLSELKELGGMLPKAQLKKVADNLAVNITDDLGDIAFFIKLYGQYGAISPKIVKRIMLQYNKAQEAEFLSYFADMVSGMSDEDLDKLIKETENNPKLNEICKRIKKRRMSTKMVRHVEQQVLPAFDLPVVKKKATKKKAKKTEELADEEEMALTK